MTGLEALAAGIVVHRHRGRVVVYGPPDREDVLDDLRFEVETRVGLDLDRESPPTPCVPPFVCWACGDPLGHEPGGSCPLCPDRCTTQRVGLCLLCVLARQKQWRR